MSTRRAEGGIDVPYTSAWLRFDRAPVRRRSPGQARRRITAGMVVVAAVLAAVGWLHAGWALGGGVRLAASAGSAAPAMAGTGPPPAASLTGATADEPAAAARRVQSFLTQGWLGGTQVDGDWGVWRGGQLQPSVSLRRRFDYLLSGAGEVTVTDLRHWIETQVTAQRGAAGAAAVLTVWDAYVALRRDAAEPGFDIDDAQSWQRALAERTRQRVAALGPAWAHAFFADEDRQTAEFVDQRAAAKAATARSAVTADAADPTNLLVPPASPLTPAQAAQREAGRVAAFGPDAAARMRVEDAAWDDWQQRLADTRARLGAIDADAQLSAPQRAEQREALLKSRYAGGDLLRARGLLGVRAP